MAKVANKSKQGIQFRQGLQLFFVRKILDDRYTMASEASSRRGIAFFSQWSQIVRAGREKYPDFPLTVKVPGEFTRRVSERPGEVEARVEAKGIKSGKKVELDLSFAQPEYHPLFKNAGFSSLVDLLRDDDLGRLMLIRYPTEVADVIAVIGATKDLDIVQEAIARSLNKKPEELTDDDYTKVERLDLAGSEIIDLDLLTNVTALQTLSLSWTNVADLKPLSNLTTLQELRLSSTKVTDLEPIKGLTSLQRLWLGDTQVSDEQMAKLREALPNLEIRW
jgi:Leucine-rich repeat (LRR) protein